MPVTQSANIEISADGSNRIIGGATANVGAGIYISDTVFNGESNFFIALGLESTLLNSFHLKSTRDVTIKTNSSGSPQETWNLKANNPIVWMSSMGAVPIAGDLTGLFVTNVSGADAVITLLAGRSPALH